MQITGKEAMERIEELEDLAKNIDKLKHYFTEHSELMTQLEEEAELDTPFLLLLSKMCALSETEKERIQTALYDADVYY